MRKRIEITGRVNAIGNLQDGNGYFLALDGDGGQTRIFGELARRVAWGDEAPIPVIGARVSIVLDEGDNPADSAGFEPATPQ